MAGRIILARAGSGKTYHIANDFENNKSTLLITFTRQNVQNIKDELYIRFNGKIPETIRVITYSSFLYSWIIRPVEGCLSFENVKSLGVDIVSEPIESTYPPTPGYVKDTELGHFYNLKNNRYYASRMSKLVVKQKKHIWKLIEARLSLLVDNLYIDEFQDFKGVDHDFLMMLLKSKKINAIAVGDFYQHSVSMGSIGSDRPYKNGKKFITEEDFFQRIPKSVELDKTTLKLSRRVPEGTCNFIVNKLKIPISSCSRKIGLLKSVEDEEELIKLLYDSSCIKLVYKNSKSFDFQPAINWSYSKGDTYKKVLVVLTENFNNLMSDDFNLKDNMSQKVINELYVALTRSNDELYICERKTLNIFLKSHKKLL